MWRKMMILTTLQPAKAVAVIRESKARTTC